MGVVQMAAKLGGMVEYFLRKRKLNQKELARAADVSEATITRMLKTGRGDYEKVLKVARALSAPEVDMLEAAGYEIPAVAREQVQGRGQAAQSEKASPPPQQPDQDFVGPTGEMTADGLAELRRLLGGMAQHETQSLTQPPSWAQKLQADVDELKALIARLARQQGKGPPEGPQPA